MTTKELIDEYVSAHGENRWMDASELEALLTEFAEKLHEPTSEDLEQAKKDAWFNYEYRDTDGRLYQSCFEDGFELGAQWQKKHLQSTVDAESPTSPIGDEPLAKIERIN